MEPSPNGGANSTVHRKIGSLIILELDLAGTEVISCTVEHSVSD